MYGLSLGVQRINEILPEPVYALLSGLNASTVGIIALAAVKLAEKAVRDKLTRLLVILGACAGICYNALWYFPMLMAFGGLTAVIWDGWLSQKFGKIKVRLRRRVNTEASVEERGTDESIIIIRPRIETQNIARRSGVISEEITLDRSLELLPHTAENNSPRSIAEKDYTIHTKFGILIVLFFLGMQPCQMQIFSANRKLQHPLPAFSSRVVLFTRLRWHSISLLICILQGPLSLAVGQS